MTETWLPTDPGVLRLPSGRLVRGRGLCAPLPDGSLPQVGVYLLDDPPPQMPWESRWLHWPDFGLPGDRERTRILLSEAWRRAATERVELACAGGHGRTGTALSCIAVMDGVPAADAVAYVRAHYRPTAVETPEQLGYVARWE